ncbi:cation transporter [Polynucleobacter paneuropaeus]|jgi:Co/Zn/Cd efflux system component|nr:cation transporter [Polynucleobacter paneuropaeus]MBT8611843.1 cation transporter [Polynucleobacter paneuropaeus]
MGTNQKSSITKTTFIVPAMDCPSEEQMIRMSLGSLSIRTMEFDISNRKLVICHSEEPNAVLDKLVPLGFGAKIESNQVLEDFEIKPIQLDPDKDAQERKVLIWLLALNGLMFFVEIVVGWIAQSAGLIADALDMFADAAVYIVALYAVGKAAQHKLKAAKLAGVVELFLAALALWRTGYQIYIGAMPEANAMIWVSLLALVVNVTCLYLIYKRKNDGAHMRASFIFSANDVLANLGVIVAGVLVAWLNNPTPDWIIGLAIGFLVLSGAIRILRLK